MPQTQAWTPPLIHGNCVLVHLASKLVKPGLNRAPKRSDEASLDYTAKLFLRNQEVGLERQPRTLAALAEDLRESDLDR